MIDKLKVPYRLPLKNVMLGIAEQAAGAGKQEAYDRALAVAASVAADRIITIKLSARDLAAAICDSLHAQGSKDVVEEVEKLVKAIRSADDRKVVGAFNFHVGSEHELSDTLEDLYKVGKASFGG